ncbi:MAG: Uncharacterised protein [Acidimicrobiales bacterium AG-410-I20]|nr:MAG: Uncharacterised protein [Acidimicrobiales bacterium AG-410-I20]
MLDVDAGTVVAEDVLAVAGDDEEDEEDGLKILGSFRRRAKFAAPKPRAIISLRRLTDFELGISNSLF